MTTATIETINGILTVLLIVVLLAVVRLYSTIHKLRKQYASHTILARMNVESKTSFLRYIGEAMRLLLTAINNDCVKLKGTCSCAPISNEDREALINNVLDSSDQLNTYLNEVQELTGFNGNVPTIYTIEVNIAELIASYRREILHEVHHGVTVGIRTNMSPHCKATLDTVMFRQLMIHFLRICARHTKRGSIIINYEWKQEGLHFVIEDNGGGLTDEYKEVITRQHVLPDGYVLSSECKLLAVDMSICESIVNSMQGTIECRMNEEEKGIVLGFWIPCYVRFD